MTPGTILGIVLFFATAAFWMWMQSGKIKPEDAKELVAKGARLVDVRTPSEFSSGHLDGALNIPLDVLEARINELDKHVPVVVYCRSGARSASAARVLQSAGFETVADLGAMSRW